jgi:hypothetical protein
MAFEVEPIAVFEQNLAIWERLDQAEIGRLRLAAEPFEIQPALS